MAHFLKNQYILAVTGAAIGVDSSVPLILHLLQPWVRIPSTPSRYAFS